MGVEALAFVADDELAFMWRDVGADEDSTLVVVRVLQALDDDLCIRWGGADGGPFVGRQFQIALVDRVADRP